MAISLLQYDVYLVSGLHVTSVVGILSSLHHHDACLALALPCPAGPIFAPDRPLSAHWLRLAALSSAPGPLFSSLSNSFCPHCLCQAHQFASWVNYFCSRRDLLPAARATYSSQPILSTLRKKRENTARNLSCPCPTSLCPKWCGSPGPSCRLDGSCQCIRDKFPSPAAITSDPCPALPCLALPCVVC